MHEHAHLQCAARAHTHARCHALPRTRMPCTVFNGGRASSTHSTPGQPHWQDPALHVVGIDQCAASNLLLAIAQDDLRDAVFTHDDVIGVVLRPGQDLSVVAELATMLVAMRLADNRAITARHRTDDTTGQPFLAVGLRASLIHLLIVEVVVVLAIFALGTATVLALGSLVVIL